jgi:hypothetical protein
LVGLRAEGHRPEAEARNFEPGLGKCAIFHVHPVGLGAARGAPLPDSMSSKLLGRSASRRRRRISGADASGRTTHLFNLS